MTVYILGCESSRLYDRPTAVLLAEHGMFEFRKILSGKKDHYSKEDVLVRYGVATYPSYDKRFGRVLNTAKAIFLNCNKLHSHIILTKNNISVPKMWTRKGNIKYPALRRRKRHSRGTDIRIMESSNEFVRGDFYTQFIDSSREYRCHIFDGNCIRLSLKVPSSSGLTGDEPIRSSTRGWTVVDHYKHLLDIERKVIKESSKAVNAIGLDFGCVDVLVEKSTNKVYVLEVNSCPRLSKYGRECYILAIRTALDLLVDDITLGLIKTWEFETPLLYRRAYRSKEERMKNTEGL